MYFVKQKPTYYTEVNASLIRHDATYIYIYIYMRVCVCVCVYNTLL
jgi:hypothetical protein